MRLDGLEHPKVYQLAAALGVTRPTTIGHLELLWAFTSKNTPQGNIGKWPDGAIARACDWTGEPEVFVDALIATRLVDECQAERLVVHDWAAHCPNFVRAKLTKSKTPFIVPVIVGTNTRSNVRSITASSRARRILPSVAQPSPAHTPTPTNTRSNAENAVEADGGDTPAAREWDYTGKVAAEPLSDTDRMDAFALIREAYPRKAGRGHNWLLAERAWAQLIDQGVTDSVTLQAGVDRYRAYVDGGGLSSDAYVLGADQFFAAVDRPWLQTWDLPKALATKSGRKTFDDYRRERPGVTTTEGEDL